MKTRVKVNSLMALMALLALMALMTTQTVQAQVRIGDNTIPVKGAVLDLDNPGGYTGGLKLPNVSITDLKQIPADFTENAGITTTTDKTALTGIVVYNTNTTTGIGVYYWDGEKWRPASAGSGGAMTIEPNPLPTFPKEGDTKDITVTSPDADGISGDYTFTVISGSDFASVSPDRSPNGKFSLTMEPNPTAAERRAVVLVVDPAGNSATFIFVQAGNPDACEGTIDPAITVSNSILFTGGAVYMYINNAEAGVNYVWMLGSNQVATGTYCITTLTGTYSVFAGTQGCPYKATQVITAYMPSTTVAPDPVSGIVASNSGVICGSSGSITLTALGNPVAANVRWFQDGKLRIDKNGLSVITLNSSNDVGEWVAAIYRSGDGAYSRPSNAVNVTYNASGGAPVTINPANALVNGQAINTLTSFCPGGSLELKINSPQPGVTYTWYNGNTVITSPYTVPVSQSSMLLRVVATDNSGGDCPGEAGSLEQPVTGTTPPAPGISGANEVCSNAATQLSATGSVGAATFEWQKNNAVLSGETGSSISAGPGTYKVRYGNAGGCWSGFSADKTVASMGAPIISWNQVYTTANEGQSYTFSVNSTGASAPSSYTWAANPAGNVTFSPASPTGASAGLTFTGSATITVTPSNNCDTGNPVTQAVTFNSSSLDAVTITTVGGSTNVCNGVSFKISKPASWTPAEWLALSESNITSTLPGALTFDGTNYYYNITATAASQIALITVSGSVAGTPMTSATSQSVTVSNSSPSSISMVGTTCFDIAYVNDGGSCGALTSRQANKADFNKYYTYSLAGTLSGTISNVTWSYTYTGSTAAVSSFIPAATGSTLASNNAIIMFNPALSTTDLGATGIEIKIVATITVTGGSGCPVAVYTIPMTVTIKDCMCCPGLWIPNGAFNERTGYISSVGTQTQTSSTTSAPNINNVINSGFSRSGRGLCVYYRDYSATANPNAPTYDTWNNFTNSGANMSQICGASDGRGVDVVDANSSWRLPNIAELAQIGQLASNNNSAQTNVITQAMVDTQVGAATGNGPLPSGSTVGGNTVYSFGRNLYWWSSTQASATNAWSWEYFSDYRMAVSSVKSITNYVRCVRTY